MLTQFFITPEAFKVTLRKARAGQHVLYHIGELAAARTENPKVEAIARLVAALTDLGLVRVYQKRESGLMHYYLVPERKLSSHDSRSSLREAERLAAYG